MIKKEYTRAKYFVYLIWLGGFTCVLEFLINLKNSHPLGVVVFLKSYAKNACAIEKNCDAKQGMGLKPLSLVVDSLIFSKFFTNLMCLIT